MGSETLADDTSYMVTFRVIRRKEPPPVATVAETVSAIPETTVAAAE